MKTALFSTVHPSAEPYVKAFLESVAAQDDCDFTLWLAFDLIEPAHFKDALAPFSDVQIVLSENDTPASLRQRALGCLLPTCDAVIFIDSDDILYPSRVSEAKLGLQTCDVYGCSLELIAQNGERLQRFLKAPTEQDWGAMMPYANVFGLSNTAYRSKTLQRLLPIPTQVKLIDWFFATRAHLSGARLSFSNSTQMAYRQYPDNTALILPPFSPAYIARAAQLVLEHLHTIIDHLPEASTRELEPFKARLRDVERFAAMQKERREAYTDALNALPQKVYLWWECVAHKELSHLWTT